MTNDIIECLDTLKYGVKGKTHTEKFASGSMAIKYKWFWYVLKYTMISLPILWVMYLILR